MGEKEDLDTAGRLIVSTRQLLWERGYGGTSPKAIQQRAGVGQGSMYHHFSGKPALALAAIRENADDLIAKSERQFSAPGPALDRIEAYLLRERPVLKGCPVGRLAQDAEVVDDEKLRAPLAETFEWLRTRLAELVAQAQTEGAIAAGLDPAKVAAALVAVLQGGYVQARAAGSAEPYERAVAGALALLKHSLEHSVEHTGGR